MVKTFQFKTKRGSKIGLTNKPLADFKPPKDETVIEPVQGVMPDSKEEYFVAKALERAKVDFIYQFDIAGGRAFRGGQVIDFMVYTVPLPTPVFVQGDYWHGGVRSAQTRFNVMMAEHLLRGQAQKPVELWDYELPDIETTYQVVKRKIL